MFLVYVYRVYQNDQTLKELLMIWPRPKEISSQKQIK